MRIFKLLLAFLFLLTFSSCSPKKLFPTDNKHYYSASDFHYSFEEHTFYSEDGTSLKGIHFKSASQSKGMIVLANGIYDNMSMRFTKWLWLVDAGYDLFTFDYRAFGESECEPDMYGFRDDVNAAVSFAHTLKPKLDITLIGQSMGGTFVIDALVHKDYEYVKLVVADSAFTSFTGILNSFMLKTVILAPLFWLPYTFSPDDLDSIENIVKLKTPILFVTGDSDWIVNYENSFELYEKAESAKSLWVVKDAGHVEAFDVKEVQKSFLEFLREKKFTLDGGIKRFNQN
jgi:hypothetical protein